MDITSDEIKFLCEMAEGFEVISKSVIQVASGFRVLINSFTTDILWKTTYYPLLLQRAIKGVISGLKYTIVMDRIGILVIDGDDNMELFEWGKSPEETELAALRYIMEQE
jgi:hypothetical protein